MNNVKITLPILDNLDPTLESTCIKLMEEAGEFAQVVGKMRGLNGETDTMVCEEKLSRKLLEELIDIMQVSVSLAVILEETYDIKLDDILSEHIVKLKEKGYLKGD